jgi:hypothetical protein
VRPGVDLDLGRQFGVLEGLLRTFFSFGERSSSFDATAIKNCALVFEACRCGLFGCSVTRPPPWNEATAPTRSGIAAAVRNAIGPPMQ